MYHRWFMMMILVDYIKQFKNGFKKLNVTGAADGSGSKYHGRPEHLRHVWTMAIMTPLHFSQ